MDSDEDTMMDVDFSATLLKGKGKALNHDVPIDNDNLPWYLSYWTSHCLSLILYRRVEKYRPINLDDVVSHKDIITTSKAYVFSIRQSWHRKISWKVHWEK